MDSLANGRAVLPFLNKNRRGMNPRILTLLLLFSFLYLVGVVSFGEIGAFFSNSNLKAEILHILVIKHAGIIRLGERVGGVGGRDGTAAGEVRHSLKI